MTKFQKTIILLFVIFLIWLFLYLIFFDTYWFTIKKIEYKKFIPNPNYKKQLEEYKKSKSQYNQLSNIVTFDNIPPKPEKQIDVKELVILKFNKKTGAIYIFSFIHPEKGWHSVKKIINSRRFEIGINELLKEQLLENTP